MARNVPSERMKQDLMSEGMAGEPLSLATNRIQFYTNNVFASETTTLAELGVLDVAAVPTKTLPAADVGPYIDQEGNMCAGWAPLMMRADGGAGLPVTVYGWCVFTAGPVPILLVSEPFDEPIVIDNSSEQIPIIPRVVWQQVL